MKLTYSSLEGWPTVYVEDNGGERGYTSDGIDELKKGKPP
jgi:hypothetical protein